MKKILLVICFFTAIAASRAQVKIGDNPNTINANSMLELESTNKGLLIPRVVLNSINATAPLTSTTPAGMLIYSSGGTVADGYYSWNGTKWLSLNTSATGRANFVLVKSASDLPAPVGGVITLVTGTLYEINGSITLTNKIDLNGCEVKGRDATNDKLIYTGSTEMFTGANGGNLMFLTLVAPAGKVFNINAGGAAKNMIVENCYIANSNSVGTIQGFAGTVFFSTIAYLANTNGITYQNNTNVLVNFTLWDATNLNTYEKFVGAFHIIQVFGGDRLTSSANSAIALDVSGVTSVDAGTAKTIMFTGTGTYVSGAFSNSWEVESFGINTEKDDVASGNYYTTTTATTVISAANTPVKALGTTSPVNLFRVSAPVSNRLAYTGNKTRRFQVIAAMTSQFTSPVSNKFFTFYIAKNGVVLPESRQKVKLINNTDQGSLTLSCTALMSTNDYIEVWVENNTDGTDIIIQSLNLAIK